MKKMLFFKPWQLFILIFMCGAWTSPSPLKEVINSVAVVSFTLWIYTVGVYGQNRIKKMGLKQMSCTLFQVNVIMTGAFFIIGFLLSAFKVEVALTPSDVFQLKDIIYALGSMYLLFAMVQPVVFVCKTITTLEYKREVSFSDYFNNLLLMLFFFVGIWFLQPKVNKLIATEAE